jgi:hydrogenase maturation protease
MRTNSKSKAIIGFGNVLMGDEGVGVRAIENLRESKRLGSGLRRNDGINADLLDGGTSGMILLHILEKYEHIIVIDAANFGGRPGEVRMFDMQTITLTPDTAQVSLHGASLAGVIELAKKLSVKLPKITIIAVQPETIAPGMSLSNVCQSAIADIIKKCRRAIL